MSDRPANTACSPLSGLLVAFLLQFVLTGVCPDKAQAADSQPCRAREPARSLVEQAQDQHRSYDARLKSYRSAIQSCPSDGALYADVSALLLQHQDGAGALAWARRGLTVAPGYASLATNLGIAQLLVGQPEEALATLKTIAPSARSFFYLGMAYRAVRDPQQARQALAKAFSLGYEDPYLLYVLIEQDREAGDKQAGLDDFRTLYERFPNSAWLPMLYGDAYAARNDNAHAEDEYRRAAQLDPNLPVVHYQLGYLAFARGDYSKAVGEFRREIAVDPAFAGAYLYLGTSLRRLGEDAEALPLLQQAVARDPNYALAYRSLAVAQIDAGQLQPALETLRTASQRFPEEPAFPAQMAGLLKRLGRAQEASQEAQEAELLSQKSNPLHPGLAPGAAADLLLKPTDGPNEGANQDAVAGPPAPKASSNSSPSDSGSVLSPGGPSPASSTTKAQSRNLDRSLVPLFECVERSDAACATSALARVKDTARTSPDYLELEARTLTLKRQKDAALADIAKAIQLAPHEYRYVMAQGEIYQSFNDQPSAIRCFLQADQLQPHVSGTFYFLGMSFFFAEDYARAKKHFQEALQLDPNNDRAAFMLGVSNMIDFKLEEAKPYFQLALKLNPNNPFCHLHYGILLSRSGDNDAALAELRTAEKLDPSYALTHYNLGHLYKETEKYPEARLELETAVRLRPSLAEALYQLGSVYHHLGMEAESQRAYQQFEQASLAEKRQVADPMESDILPSKVSTE
ncbi:MAG TPA: tetratricopeptide repeat protein [Terriglobia bacterium]